MTPLADVEGNCKSERESPPFSISAARLFDSQVFAEMERRGLTSTVLAAQ